MASHRADPDDEWRGAVQRDDALMDRLGDPEYIPGQGELARALAAHRREVHADSDRDLIDTDTALAAMKVDVGSPFVAGVTLLVVVMMIGATLGVVMAHVVTGYLSGVLAALALPAICVALAVGVVAYRERRR